MLPAVRFLVTHLPLSAAYDCRLAAAPPPAKVVKQLQIDYLTSTTAYTFFHFFFARHSFRRCVRPPNTNAVKTP